MPRLPHLALLTLLLIPACASGARQGDPLLLHREVTDSELAFARTMADRDHAAFTALLADDAVFFSGERPVRGKQAVAAEWKRYFDGASAPFSWKPDHVEVLASETLAHTSGPVHDRQGKLIGRFNSVWRREASGRWRVVFDKGSPVCATAGGAE